MRSGARWFAVLLVAVAIVLHLPAHFGVRRAADGAPDGAASGAPASRDDRSWLAPRETLVGDGPVVATNRAFETHGTEVTSDLVRRALLNPAASFDDGNGIRKVGRNWDKRE